MATALPEARKSSVYAILELSRGPQSWSPSAGSPYGWSRASSTGGRGAGAVLKEHRDHGTLTTRLLCTLAKLHGTPVRATGTCPCSLLNRGGTNWLPSAPWTEINSTPPLRLSKGQPRCSVLLHCQADAQQQPAGVGGQSPNLHAARWKKQEAPREGGEGGS